MTSKGYQEDEELPPFRLPSDPSPEMRKTLDLIKRINKLRKADAQPLLDVDGREVIPNPRPHSTEDKLRMYRVSRQFGGLLP